MRCENCNKRLLPIDYQNGRCSACGKSEKTIKEILILRGGYVGR